MNFSMVVALTAVPTASAALMVEPLVLDKTVAVALPLFVFVEALADKFILLIMSSSEEAIVKRIDTASA
jgi:hypothetical protein